MRSLPQNPASIQEIHAEFLVKNELQLFIKREDLLDPIISGNKYRKLKYNLVEAEAKGKSALLTFGGAYSNHIHALAYAGKTRGFKTIGIIRGERVEPLNPTLRDAESFGMHLEFIGRTAYREKNAQFFIEQLKDRYGDVYVVPEGGSNVLAVRGCEEIVNELTAEFDYVCCCCGTGGTLAGIISGLDGRAKALGFPVLKGGEFLNDAIRRLIYERTRRSYHNWQLVTDYHFGGYAKFTPELIGFINEFKEKYHLSLDPVYTGKMFYGLFDLIGKNFFRPETKILAIHTGGLQGIRGFNERFGDLIK